MPEFLKAYVRRIEAVNRWVGLFAMYLVFAMLAILLYSSISKTFFTPSLWTLEMAQFTMVAYYLLGGGRSMQINAHVRMDLFYSTWTPRTQATIDAVTILFLIFFLIMLLYGGYSSTHYAVRYSETSYSSWSPYMAPIKILMTCAIFLTLLQAIANLIRDIAKARGEPLP